jgi:hypothetical protein
MNQNTYMCIKSNITLHVLSKSASQSHLHTYYIIVAMYIYYYVTPFATFYKTKDKQGPIISQSQKRIATCLNKQQCPSH